MDTAAWEQHYKNLERMYGAAPFNELFNYTIAVSEASAVIEIELTRTFHHAAGAIHGSIYFKMLDDAAYFAANSLETDYFVLTTSFTTYLTRPVSAGKMRAVGRVVNKNKSQFIAESIVYNDDEQEIGRGNGIFVRGKQLLINTPGYRDPES